MTRHTHVHRQKTRVLAPNISNVQISTIELSSCKIHLRHIYIYIKSEWLKEILVRYKVSIDKKVNKNAKDLLCLCSLNQSLCIKWLWEQVISCTIHTVNNSCPRPSIDLFLPPCNAIQNTGRAPDTLTKLEMSSSTEMPEHRRPTWLWSGWAVLPPNSRGQKRHDQHTEQSDAQTHA